MLRKILGTFAGFIGIAFFTWIIKRERIVLRKARHDLDRELKHPHA